jgi:hypothetical protein
MFSVQRAVVAAALTVAAAPFAMGGELPAWLVRSGIVTAAEPVPLGSDAVNLVERAGKSDRATVARSSVDSTTFSIQPNSLSNTSVLVRIVNYKSDRRIGPATEKPATRLQPAGKASKPRGACEAVVSMLTEVAKQLAPGRCIT